MANKHDQKKSCPLNKVEHGAYASIKNVPRSLAQAKKRVRNNKETCTMINYEQRKRIGKRMAYVQENKQNRPKNINGNR